MKLNRFAAAFLSLLIAFSVQAGNLKFSSLLGDNMVLQQNTQARIWGSASPRASVSVSASWLKSAVSTRADAEGHWEVLLKTPAATFEPQTVRASSGGEAVRAVMIARRSRTVFYGLMAIGCAALISLQTFVIIGGNIKLIPLTGVTLPFISYGGTSMLSSLCLIGFLQGIASRNAAGMDEDRALAMEGGVRP